MHFIQVLDEWKSEKRACVTGTSFKGGFKPHTGPARKMLCELTPQIFL